MVESGAKWVAGGRSVYEAPWRIVKGRFTVLTKEGEVRMFMGEYSHTIDAKGRMIIPSKFREELGEEFVLTKGLDGCLSIYPNSEWKAFEEKLKALPLNDKNARAFLRFFVASATMCELDKQGRILVPITLREFAGLEKDVVLTGNLTRIEVWSKEKWLENSNYEDMDAIAEGMQSIGIVI